MRLIILMQPCLISSSTAIIISRKPLMQISSLIICNIPTCPMTSGFYAKSLESPLWHQIKRAQGNGLSHLGPAVHCLRRKIWASMVNFLALQNFRLPSTMVELLKSLYYGALPAVQPGKQQSKQSEFELKRHLYISASKRCTIVRPIPLVGM